jgi:hypothetical protein
LNAAAWLSLPLNLVACGVLLFIAASPRSEFRPRDVLSRPIVESEPTRKGGRRWNAPARLRGAIR